MGRLAHHVRCICIGDSCNKFCRFPNSKIRPRKLTKEEYKDSMNQLHKIMDYKSIYNQLWY